MKVKLSVVIITLNEEKNIARCISSVTDIAEDIVVVDSFSTDNTVAICQNLGARVIQHPFEGYIEQKNWAIKQAKFPHILSLDADEALDEKAVKNILKIKNNWEHDGYYFNRLTNYCGQWIWHCGWYPDKKLRLWDSRKGQWQGNNPHDKYEMFAGDKTTSFIKGNILHYSYYSVNEHVIQTAKFAKIIAKSMYAKKVKTTFINRNISPIFRFIRDYFLFLGFLDGKAGYVISKITSQGTFLKYNNLYNLWQSKGQTTMSNNFQKIIISRTDAIGDVILTLPMCGLIKKYYPNVKIIFLGRSYTQAIIEHCEHVDEFINADTLLQLPEKEAVAQLKLVKADTIIHVYPKSSIAALAKQAGIKLRIGTTNRTFHLFSVNKLVFLSRRNSDLHEAQLNCKLLSPLGIEIYPNLQELATYTGLNKAIPTSSIPVDKTKTNIILHPKSNASAREWGLQNFKALIQLMPKDKFTFYISGTNQEKEILADWISTLPENVIDITGKFNLNEFIGFIAQADYLVAASTGPLHLAAALGIGAIGIYPPMRPIHPGRWQPIGPKARFLVIEKECDDCAHDPSICACMNLVAPLEVAQFIHPKQPVDSFS